MKKNRPDTFSNFRFRELVEEFIQGERNRAVLIRFYVDDKSYGELMREFNLSLSSVKRITHGGGHKIFKMMAKEIKEIERQLSQE